MSPGDAVRALTGQDVLYRERLHGGDLSDVFRLTLTLDHSTCVAKIGPKVAQEARMLEALARAGAPVPDVFGVSGDVLLMEDLPESPATSQGWARLGTALRALHATTDTEYGWAEDYAFGKVRIPNTPKSSWPEFWAEQRLMADPGALPADIAGRVEVLARRLPDLLPATPPAALLHGDLWRGNVHFSHGTAYLIDPACTYGDAEVDLAMLNLFGHPPAAFAEGYGPLPAGHEKRRPLYQLWPALVHLRLFGTGYRAMVTRLLEQVGA